MVVGGTRDGFEVQVRGQVADINRAFNVTLSTYKHPSEERIFFSAGPRADDEPAVRLWHVSGLDNFSIPHPLYCKAERLCGAARHIVLKKL